MLYLRLACLMWTEKLVLLGRIMSVLDIIAPSQQHCDKRDSLA